MLNSNEQIFVIVFSVIGAVSLILLLYFNCKTSYVTTICGCVQCGLQILLLFPVSLLILAALVVAGVIKIPDTDINNHLTKFLLN